MAESITLSSEIWLMFLTYKPNQLSVRHDRNTTDHQLAYTRSKGALTEEAYQRCGESTEGRENGFPTNIIGDITGAMTGTSDNTNGEWLTIAEAAERLGVKPIAIRARIRRGTLRVRPASRENDHRTKVWIDASADVDNGINDGTSAGASTGANDSTVKALKEHLATLREQVEREREAHDRARADQERTRIELAEERRNARDLVDRLNQAHQDRLADAERHRAELEVLRADLAAERARPWWRRVRR